MKQIFTIIAATILLLFLTVISLSILLPPVTADAETSGHLFKSITHRR